ncbi:hypothetical protein HAX54_051014 [Datura stramonium]|uniref:Uncharacterized protein n=1 Tax=Datura stramonium TaxID=4076 RepID=A0ABS8RUI3_DATST|nr:hypothetical protein [Datura stramonium]
MSTRERRAQPTRRTRSRSRRNVVLSNGSKCCASQVRTGWEGTSIDVLSGDTTHGQTGASLTPAAIDVEALDDDVIISSPRAFAARTVRLGVTVVEEFLQIKQQTAVMFT